MKKILVIVIIVALAGMFSGCAAGTNSLKGTEDENGKVAGFFQGLWNGFISFFTFIISIFTDKVNIYDVHNSGFGYNLGFILGASAFFGGSGGAGGRAARRRRRIKDE